MKSIKPIVENTQATLIANDIAAELRSAIESLNNAVNNLTNQVSDVETKVDNTAVSKQSGDFDSVRTKNLNVSTKATVKEASIQDLNATNVTAERTKSGIVSSDNISTEELSAHDASIDNLTTNTVSTSSLTTDTITADGITTDNANIKSTTSNKLNAVDATVSNLEVQSISNLADFTSDTLTATSKVNAPLVLTNKVLTDEIATLSAKIEELTTRNTIFNTDETDPNQFVDLTGELSYIEIPAVSSGYYRINVRNDDGTYWAVTFINTETAPIVQYSKVHNGDIGGIYYDSITRKLYVKTYSTGRIFWSNNDKHGNLAPVVYPELPIDSSAITTFRYRAAATNRLVIMGDNTADFGLTVQGLLEANIIKDGTAYHQLFFYGDSWAALHTFADKYLTWEDPNEVKHYLQSETSGYLYHKNDTYKSPDMEDCEAFEKVAFDGTNVTFTLDTKQGQDEIEVNGTGRPAGYYPYTGLLNDTTAYVKDIPAVADILNYELHPDFTPADLANVVLVVFGGPYDPDYPQAGSIWYPIDDGENLKAISTNKQISSSHLQLQTAHFVTRGDFIKAHFIGITQLDEHLQPTDHDYRFNPTEPSPVQGTLMVGGNTLSWKDAELSTDIYSYQEAETQEDELPFIISFSAASRPWDELMNSEVFNSYSNERQ